MAGSATLGAKNLIAILGGLIKPKTSIALKIVGLRIERRDGALSTILIFDNSFEKNITAMRRGS